MTVKRNSNPFAYVNFYINKGITVSNVVEVRGGKEKFIVKLFDDKNNPLIGETVAIFINGLKYTAKSDSSGIASINLNLEPGEYDVVSVHDKNTISSKLKVVSPTILTVNDISMGYNEYKDWIITLKDSLNNPLIDKLVTIDLNGETFYERTDNDGQIEFYIPDLDPNTYVASFSFAGDNFYLKNSTTAKLKVSKVASKLTVSNVNKVYKQTKNWVILLKDSNGYPLNDKLVTIVLNGVKYNKNTNPKGQVTLAIPTKLLPNTYTATFSFAGDKEYNKVTKKS